MARFNNPVPLVLDDNGDPIVGAELFFYEPGTTTLKTIYSDSGLTTATTNPQVSVSGGRYTGDIFLDGIYKVVQKDDNSVTIWTKDPVGDVVEGQFELWLTGNTYNIPEIVLGSDDEYYRSLADGNQGNDPATTPASWEQLKFGRVWNTNVTYAAGDTAYGSNGNLYISRTGSNSGNNPISNTTNWESFANNRFTKGSNIPSGAPTVPTDGNLFDVTGTTAILAFVVSEGYRFTAQFDGIVKLTHHVTDLILPGGRNIFTAAGDVLEFFAYADNDVVCTNVQTANVISFAEEFISSEQTVTADTLLDVAHGLSSKPKIIQVVLINKTTEFGYSVGDEVTLGGSGTIDQNVTVASDTTNVTIVQGSAINVHLQSTFNGGQITVGNWRWIVRAWA